MKRITIAVISDLHIGSGARSRDLCPPGTQTNAIENGYGPKFLSFLHKHNIRADFLILPGDVTHLAQPAEFELASGFITAVIKQLKVPKPQVVFVPGNHDVNWDMLKLPDPTGFWRDLRYHPLVGSKWIFSKVLGRSDGDVLKKPYLSSWTFENMVVVGYNSSLDDDPKLAEHRGSLADEHLDKLAEYLSSLNLSASQLRIFLVHHHPVPYSDPVNDPPDVSIMTNAERLLDILQLHHFDLLIHGHKHRPNFRTHIIDSGAPLAILGSGSFSIGLDTRWSGHVNNQFHLLEVNGRDEFGCIFGKLESWAYLSGKGWIPSKTSSGIRHIMPFGTYILPARLKTVLRPIIAKGIETNRHIGWSEITKLQPEFQYLANDLVLSVLEDLSAELDLKRYGELPDDVILVRLGAT